MARLPIWLVHPQSRKQIIIHTSNTKERSCALSCDIYIRDINLFLAASNSKKPTYRRKNNILLHQNYLILDIHTTELNKEIEIRNRIARINIIRLWDAA